jgi:nucleoside phosphorylase
MSLSSPRDRRGFEIAIICALQLEAECVQAVFTTFWGDKVYGKAAGDTNAYTTGVIENHNVVLAYMPEIGIASASGTAAALRSSFPNIRLALMVGVCGGVPYDISRKQAIWLGDIIICETPVHYRFGSQYPEKFKRNTMKDSIGRSSQEIRTILAKLKTPLYHSTLLKDISEYLLIVQQEVSKANHPGSESDKLYESTYLHKHHGLGFHVIDDECAMGEKHICSRAQRMNCEELQCAANRLVRCRLTDASGLRPSVHFGKVGSGDTVMKSAEDRDQIAGEDGVIAFEMEGGGVWDHFPSVLTLKGVCDYADSHKNKQWQYYAAATAAACLKAFLKVWVSGDQQPDELLISLPSPRNTNFVGRDQILQKIHEEITSHRFQGSDCIQFPVYGMGGIGKTQTILEYAYRYRENFSSIFWVNANTYESAVASYFTIAQKIGLVNTRDRDTGNTMSGEDAGRSVYTVKEWLVKRENNNWLLLFDNWDNLEDERMELLLPNGGSGIVLITSRRQERARTRHSLEIPEMGEEDCLLLLSNGASTEYWESDLAGKSCVSGQRFLT